MLPKNNCAAHHNTDGSMSQCHTEGDKGAACFSKKRGLDERAEKRGLDIKTLSLIAV